MGMSRIDFQNTVAFPMPLNRETPLQTPPRIPYDQGSGTENKDVVIPENLVPSEVDSKTEFERELVQQIIVPKGKEILKDLEPPITSTRLKIDEENRRIVIQILDTKKNEVIRQIPPEEWLKFLSRWQKVQGLFFNEQI